MILTISFLVTAIAGVLLYFWHNIMNCFQTIIIPWVRNTLGSTSADILGEILSYADNVATLTRKQVKTGWQWICQNILGSESTYEQLDASFVRITNKTYIRSADAVYEQTSTTTASWDELPASVRKKMIINNEKEVDVNDHDIIKEKYKTRAEKEGISLEDAA